MCTLNAIWRKQSSLCGCERRGRFGNKICLWSKSTDRQLSITEFMLNRRNYLAAEKMGNKGRKNDWYHLVYRASSLRLDVCLGFVFVFTFFCFSWQELCVFFFVSTFVNWFFFSCFVCKENIKHRHSCVNICCCCLIHCVISVFFALFILILISGYISLSLDYCHSLPRAEYSAAVTPSKMIHIFNIVHDIYM